MIKTKRRGLKVSMACLVVLMLLLSMMPGGSVVMSPKVEAYGENEDGTLYYAEATLYDYKYDREVGNYTYDHDNQIAYKRNSDGVQMSQEDCHNLINGDRWMTGLQVPYERLNRKISAFYEDKDAPALYLGNFYGTATNLPESRGNDAGQTPWQYTYISGQDGNKSYADAYNKFWESANGAPLNNNGNVAIQGLVDRKLNANGTLTQNNGAFELPLFSDSFIEANSTLMQKYPTSNGFPFNIIHNADGTKTYKFDSANDAPRYYKDGAFAIGTLSQNGVANWRSDGKNVTAGGYGFFPFNSSSITKTEVGREKVNYGFGMKVDIPFNLSENGTILDKDNNEVDVIFEFSGDDDVWVFIDGILMLDIGGDHAKVQGNINFNRNNQKVWIDHASTFNKNRNKYEKADSSNGGGAMNSTIVAMYQAAGETFDADTFYNTMTQHTLTVFYMERGMFESNLSISFNFATLNPHKLTVKEKTIVENVNPGLLKKTIGVADKDIFNYSIENKGTGASVVKDSGFKVPTYDYINRNNTEAGNTTLINRLSGQTPEYTSQTSRTFDSDYIYFAPSDSWKASDRVIAAWVWNSNVSGSSKYALFSYDDATGYYKAERKGCDKMKLTLYEASNHPSDGQTSWQGSGKKDEWGHDIIFETGKNVYLSNGDKWSDTPVEQVTTVDVLKQETHNFTPVGTDYNQVANVTYQLTDPFGMNKDTGTAQTTMCRDTTGTGTFGLMYNETADFQYQFQKNSTMRVKQNISLLQPMDNRAETIGSQNGNRLVSTYYNTTVNVVDIDNRMILERDISSFNNYNNDGTYTFANHPDTLTKTVHLTETYINTIKVGAIKISKVLAPAENIKQNFTFQVTLSKLFGDTTDDGKITDYSGVEVYIDGVQSYLTADGQFSMDSDQTAVIQGIPVQTDYLIEEVLDADAGFEIDTANTINCRGTVTESTADNTTHTGKTVNKRKTDSLTITKTITGSGADLNDTFPVTVTFTAPAGVDLSGYLTQDKITVSGQVTNLAISLPTITFTVTNGSSVTISNIPYGTNYEVTEEAGDYTQAIVYSDNGKIIDTPATASDTVAITNTREDVKIVLTKKNDRGTIISGAQFAIYDNLADAKAKNTNTVSGAVYEVNPDGTIFTFSRLKANTTYYIAETVTPPGHKDIEAFPITTGAAGSTQEEDVFNPVIDIQMPETGVLPDPLNMTVVGLSIIGIAAIAFFFYRRKLQTEAIYTDSDKEV